MRAVGLHADVVVATSRLYQTTCTLVRSGGEAFCIDSPVLPDELELLPAVAEQAGFTVVGLLATHADWDHLLGRYAFPEAPLGCAETTAGRLVNEPGAAQRELRAFDEQFYLERPRPLSLPSAQRLPVPGKLEVGDRELELQPADGHTEDGMAVWVPWARVLVCGDYLSPTEIPMLAPNGSASAYLATLARLEPLVEQAEHVVPGHGGPIDAARAAAILREDRAYLEALIEHGEAAKLPLARRTAEQRRIHAENARHTGEPARGGGLGAVRRAGSGDERGESDMHRLDPELAGSGDERGESDMHRLDPELASAIVETALERLRADPPPLGSAPPPDAPPIAAITAEGLGGERALALVRDVVLPATTAIDHPRYLAFIPSAPTPASALLDLLVSAFAVYGGSWLESAGAVRAENEALSWLAELAGLPPGAGGCFVQGGTGGNLSALHAAREWARHSGRAAARVAVSEEVHSSVRSMLRVMDAGTLEVPGARLTGAALREALEVDGGAGVFAVVATAGTTNLGQLDDLAGVAAVCRERGLWLHVDGAYGLAALCAPSVRDRFAGIEHADSFIVDPHKWLYAPFDSCALVYREPAFGRAAHRQHAPYLESLHADDAAFNPSDYAVHLTRRPRGLPFWFSLVVHGTDAYAEAIERTLAITRELADEIRAREELELLAEPELTVVAFRRRSWAPADYERWAADLRETGTAFVLPTTVAGETVARLALVSPRTTIDDLRVVLDAMRAGG